MFFGLLVYVAMLLHVEWRYIKMVEFIRTFEMS